MKISIEDPIRGLYLSGQYSRAKKLERQERKHEWEKYFPKHKTDPKKKKARKQKQDSKRKNR